MLSSFLSHVLVVCYGGVGYFVARQSVLAYYGKEMGTLRSRILFPFSNTVPTYGGLELTFCGFVNHGGTFRLGDPFYYLFTMTVWPLRIAWASVWWSCMGLVTLLRKGNRWFRGRKFREPPKVRVAEDETARTVYGLAAERDVLVVREKELWQDLEKVRERRRYLDALLDEPQGDAFRGALLRAKARTS